MCDTLSLSFLGTPARTHPRRQAAYLNSLPPAPVAAHQTGPINERQALCADLPDKGRLRQSPPLRPRGENRSSLSPHVGPFVCRQGDGGAIRHALGRGRLPDEHGLVAPRPHRLHVRRRRHGRHLWLLHLLQRSQAAILLLAAAARQSEHHPVLAWPAWRSLWRVREALRSQGHVALRWAVGEHSADCLLSRRHEARAHRRSCKRAAGDFALPVHRHPDHHRRLLFDAGAALPAPARHGDRSHQILRRPGGRGRLSAVRCACRLGS